MTDERNDQQQKLPPFILNEKETQNFKIWASVCESFPADLSGLNIDAYKKRVDKQKQDGSLSIKYMADMFVRNMFDDYELPERPVGALTQEHLDTLRKAERLSAQSAKASNELYFKPEAPPDPLRTAELKAAMKEADDQSNQSDFKAAVHAATEALLKEVAAGHVKANKDGRGPDMCEEYDFAALNAVGAFSDLKFAHADVEADTVPAAPARPPKTVAAGSGYLLDTTVPGQAHLIFLSGVEKNTYAGWQAYFSAYQEQCPDQPLHIEKNERGYVIHASEMDGNALANLINQGLSEIASGSALSANSCAVDKPSRGR